MGAGTQTELAVHGKVVDTKPVFFAPFSGQRRPAIRLMVRSYLEN